jgi:hypothetical protein
MDVWEIAKEDANSRAYENAYHAVEKLFKEGFESQRSQEKITLEGETLMLLNPYTDLYLKIFAESFKELVSERLLELSGL